MKCIHCAFFWLTAGAVAQAADLATTCTSGLDTELQPGRELRMELRSAAIHIIGRESTRLRVSCELRHPERSDDVAISFKPTPAGGTLRIRGGPRDDTQFRIEVPRQTHLFVRTPAGELKVRGVTGNKDIGLRAGELTITVDDPAEYKQTDVAVRIGELSAPIYGIGSKGGFFRSFRTSRADGKYRLNARLTVGELNLK
ncbi:MAG TPA: hypothetical protein VFL57_16295 [Bryobacteraceae bacterium]|nr:hypothetical protein [Bryobacteraceae bacterium]